MKKSKFSLIIDETTDISTSKCLAVVVRFFDPVCRKVRDRFLALIPFVKFDAFSIFTLIKDFLSNAGIPMANLIGFASDNASVMMGRKGGVRSHFETENAHLYVMGCNCHSLHLCSSAACKVLPSNLEQLTRNIGSYFAHSSKRLLDFEKLQELFNTKPHKLLKTSSTRWLALGNVVDRISEQWKPLKLFSFL